jgi:hypothetical protein
MIRFLDTLPLDKYCPRVYVVADTDKDSAGHAKAFEQSKHQDPSLYSIRVIPRSREVGQSYVSSVKTTIKSFIFSVRMMLDEQPDVVLTNGPGTCVPIAVLALIFRVRTGVQSPVSPQGIQPVADSGCCLLFSPYSSKKDNWFEEMYNRSRGKLRMCQAFEPYCQATASVSRPVLRAVAAAPKACTECSVQRQTPGRYNSECKQVQAQYGFYSIRHGSTEF